MITCLKLFASAALLCALSSCWAVDYFHGDPTRYDNLYFGSAQDAPMAPRLKDDKWRNYAVYGLVVWDEPQTLFAGNRLGAVPADSRPMKMFVRSEETFVNVLAGLGVSLVLGPFGPLLFMPRTSEVVGWTDG